MKKPDKLYLMRQLRILTGLPMPSSMVHYRGFIKRNDLLELVTYIQSLQTENKSLKSKLEAVNGKRAGIEETSGL